MSLRLYCQFNFSFFSLYTFFRVVPDHLWLELVSDSQTTGVPGFHLHNPSFLKNQPERDKVGTTIKPFRAFKRRGLFTTSL